LLALALFAGTGHAAITVHGSTTAYQTTDKDWLSHTTNDIDGNGLGTDGFLFFGDFDGTAENGQPWGHDVRSSPGYVTGFAAGTDFASIADEFPSPGYGFIDDPIALNGTDRRSGVGLGTGGGAGSLRQVFSFTVSGLTQTVRVGVLSGTEHTTDGRWDPTSITLSDGSNSATVGNHSTSPLPASPGGINVGWVFFDIDADGTYTVSGTKRLAAQGAGIGGVTFDSVPEPSTFALAALGLLGLLTCGRRRRR